MANTNIHGDDLIRHCGLNDEGKAVEQMHPQAFHRLIGKFCCEFDAHHMHCCNSTSQ
jgi:hypothetical protein